MPTDSAVGSGAPVAEQEDEPDRRCRRVWVRALGDADADVIGGRAASKRPIEPVGLAVALITLASDGAQVTFRAVLIRW